MKDIKELYQKLNELPSGYISIKNISNKDYYYLKYYENGKQKSKYIKANDIELIRKQLKERKQIETEIKEYEKNRKKITLLSKNAISLTGSVMLGDEKVATYKQGQLLYKNEKLCPLIIKRTNNVSLFLKGRVIDFNRTNSRLLRKVLNINSESEEQVSLHVYGAVITDNYWFKPSGSKLKYKDISFDNDYYSDLALKGELAFFPKLSIRSPQITTIGSFEKCWKKINNEWWLYKSGTNEQYFSEIFCSLLAKELGIPTVIYEYDDGFIRTKNFASKYNFDPMIGLMGDEENYNEIFESLFSIKHSLAQQYLLLSFFDCLVNNIDRHNENLGFLRDKKTGKIISLAPNFDNNLALLGYDKKLIVKPNKDGMINLFIKFIKKNENAYEMYKKLDINRLNKKIIRECMSKTPVELDGYDVENYIIKRYEYLVSFKNNK